MYVHQLLGIYGPMLSAVYVERRAGLDGGGVNIEIPVHKPPFSQGWVLERIYLSTEIIFFEAVRRTLLKSHEYDSEENAALRKSVIIILEMLKIAENPPEVLVPPISNHKLLSTNTMNLGAMTSESLTNAEPPHTELISDVKWLADEVHGLCQSGRAAFQAAMRQRANELVRQYFPDSDEALESAFEGPATGSKSD